MICENSVDAHIGFKIRKAREERRWGEQAFAKKLNIPVCLLIELERGSKRLEPKLLFRILKLLSIDMRDLFSGLPLQGRCGSVRLSFVGDELGAHRPATG